MPTNTLPPWLSDAMEGLAAGDVDAWTDTLTEDAVHEFPFAAPGAPERIEGREAIRAYLTVVLGHVRFGTLSGVRAREIGDEVVVEAEGHHHDAAGGDPFDLRYVWIITLRDGRMARIRDYMGPRRPGGGAA
ncbi:hypothetical protein RVR_4124 [Actinacidiphila reveromycinica]|uniref:SnoaL-like domain-containing protein n=1 Tax=Actinacidiphila reveromycinica TaxID=659352 RepID=A0A7U3USV8_9ACTN|nr:nuclear transport factor 2 family protein [Streptomyces sp. SN-593]BBA98076.1 hypothetical protein RVR_4124 [Streptomyces sp. SN-593]